MSGYTGEYDYDDKAPAKNTHGRVTEPGPHPPAFEQAPVPPPTVLRADLLYVSSARLSALERNFYVHNDRSTVVHSLIKAAGLLEGEGVVVEEAVPAAPEDLRRFHSPEYVLALANASFLGERELERFGLVDSCSPFPG
jgi:hypothetical protein